MTLRLHILELFALAAILLPFERFLALSFIGLLFSGVNAAVALPGARHEIWTGRAGSTGAWGSLLQKESRRAKL